MFSNVFVNLCIHIDRISFSSIVFKAERVKNEALWSMPRNIFHSSRGFFTTRKRMYVKGWSIVVKNAREAQTSPRGSRETSAHQLLLNGALYWEVCYSNLNITEVTSSEYSKISFSFFLLKHLFNRSPLCRFQRRVSRGRHWNAQYYSYGFDLLKTNGLPGLRENTYILYYGLLPPQNNNTFHNQSPKLAFACSRTYV